MRLGFAGTPDFAAVALRALLVAGHEVELVLTQPDRAAGRGLAMRPSPVKRLAQAAGLRLLQPPTLRDPLVEQEIRSRDLDVLVVAAYGLILPQAILDLPLWGCINIHASLLPRWRGAAPIQRAILAGDRETGISIMQMDAGLDSGPVLLSARQDIRDDDTAASLHDRLADLGAGLLLEVLDRLPFAGCEQPAEGIAYAAKIDKAEAVLDWRLPAVQLARQVRAFNPLPVARCSLGSSVLKVWAARPLAACGAPGLVLGAGRDGLLIACGEGALCIEEVQQAGGRRMSAAEFLNGLAVPVGSRCPLLAP
ncbi:methionyl-tRNA formyltransferase [Accumulibacter sp.]|uniref:methionyl-tRNA formyltransferase n=1 Tax=Accumulibacter sp. TaxID=2053492 RepID=UPI0025E27662|nr:methionyl-tRNA formyltransferase [Accumulibacter sp.]MCM8612153.1 methionyl-tRNA formyltransferase [Accumulibacter sp.]MCM8635819.1 methionyl-tRNA formyltransferase [Accumulibacter sp.]MCM8639544.1 methionyl-tRNA formyltransferase [Accumulibacter sp.]